MNISPYNYYPTNELEIKQRYVNHMIEKAGIKLDINDNDEFVIVELINREIAEKYIVFMKDKKSEVKKYLGRARNSKKIEQYQKQYDGWTKQIEMFESFLSTQEN